MSSSKASSWSSPDEDPVPVDLDRRSDCARWEATERHGITPAPGPLALVHDLLNTHGSDDGEPDLLSSPDDAQRWADGALRAWSSASGHPYAPTRLGSDAATVLRDLRDALSGRSVVARTGDTGAAASIEVSVDAAAGGWSPTGEGVQRLRSAVLGEVLVSRSRGTWSRLRQCRHESCRVTFFDRTWDQRQTWHDTTTAHSHRHPAPGERS